MSYVRASLGRNERIVARARHHWIMPLVTTAFFVFWVGVWSLLILFSKPLGTWLASLTDGMADVQVKPEWAVWGLRGLAGLVILICIVRFIAFWIWLASTEYAVTNWRVVMKSGLIRRRTYELRLNQVESVRIGQGLRGRLLGFGVVSITGSGGSTGSWSAIAYPLDFKRSIEHAMSQIGQQPAQQAAQKADEKVAEKPAEAASDKPAASATGTYRVHGVNEAGEDVELVVEAKTPENARIKAEMQNVRVGSVEPA